MNGFVLLLVLIFQSKLINGNDELLSKFHQNEYKIREFRCEAESYNKSVFNFYQIKTFKYNRTTPAVNGSVNFKIDVQDKIEILIQAYKLLSNEYRTFPVRFQVNLKKALKANVGGISDALLHCSNIRKFEFYKDITYYVCNFAIDETHLPPLIPSGSYKIAIKYLYLDGVIGRANVYYEIYRPIPYPKK